MLGILHIYSLNSGHFTSFFEQLWMIGLSIARLESLVIMFPYLTEATSKSFRSGILDEWISISGSNINCNPVIIFQYCVAVQLEQKRQVIRV